MAALGNVNKVLTERRYNAYLSLIKGFRNGAVYVYNWPVILQKTMHLFSLSAALMKFACAHECHASSRRYTDGNTKHIR